MIDLHCHILPGVDDGASTLEDALCMAEMAAQSGVTAIVATPHCNLPRTIRQNYLDAQLMEHVTRFRAAVEAAGIPLRIYAGAEIFCTPELPRLLEQNKLMSLAGSRYLLAEFYFDEEPEFINQSLRDIARKGFIPVIAHPERYEAVQETPALAEQWFACGCILQLNKGSIMGKLGREETRCAQWILDRGFAHVVASDAHSPRVRTPHMHEIRRYLEERWDPEYAKLLLSTNPANILRDRPVVRG